MKKPETITSIITSKRNAAKTLIEEANGNLKANEDIAGNPFDAWDFDDFIDRANELIHGADRLEAALKRECEVNCPKAVQAAKLSEAVKCLMNNLNIHLMLPSQQITINRAELDAMVMVCEKALATPQEGTTK